MAIYQIKGSELNAVAPTTFGTEGVRERYDLQRMLRTNIEVIAPGTMVLAEEFGDWDESKRRIDLLAVDLDANLVIVELKRTEDGGHMELQAIRYAAMVSTMTFDQAVEAHARFRASCRLLGDPREAILEFLGWSEPDDERFARDVRIVLASAEFSKELTTAVLWLNNKASLDIRCVRLKPYALDGTVLLDVQQVLPLPEATEYQIQVKAKEQSQQSSVARYNERRAFWQALLERARGRTALHANVSPTTDNWLGTGVGRNGLTLSYVVRQHEARVELYIDFGAAPQNELYFQQLMDRRVEIESAFGGELEWQEVPEGRRMRRVLSTIPGGGYRDPGAWPEIQDRMIDTMVRFEAALKPHLV